MSKFLLGCLILSPLWSVFAYAQSQVPRGLIHLSDNAYFSPYALVVDKSERKTAVWKQDGDNVVRILEFPSDQGKRNGDKASAGDHRTPESIYFFEKMLEGQELLFDKYGVRAFTMDYPNPFDQLLGKTGSGIWLHAIPDTETLERGSKGCVVVRNQAILELSKFINLNKTPILIFDKVPMVSHQERTKTSSEIESWLAAWTNAWQTKNLEKYMSFYSQSFESNKMDWKKWRSFKGGLNEKYDKISVALHGPVIYEHSGNYVIRTLQSYKSDQHSDFGEKVLYAHVESNGEIKIISETWAPVDDLSFQTQVARCCTNEPKTANATN